ncbi:hypothetical protein BDZ45DRAFT_811727 [Acephala macrosclerotiorum]|nr:hypothetical protein BDZ45DRAFT_811727 [Acephala macrosclerotiorum]
MAERHCMNKLRPANGITSSSSTNSDTGRRPRHVRFSFPVAEMFNVEMEKSVSFDEKVSRSDSVSPPQNVSAQDSASTDEKVSRKDNGLPPQNVCAKHSDSPPQFNPKYITEWLHLLSSNGFLNGTYSEKVFDTDFESRSVVIWTSWLCPTFSTSSTQARGRIIGKEIFYATFEMDVNIAELLKHLEEISNTFLDLIETSEKEKEAFIKSHGLEGKVKTSELREQVSEGNGGGKGDGGGVAVSQSRVQELCFALLEGMVREIKEEMKNLEASPGSDV